MTITPEALERFSPGLDAIDSILRDYAWNAGNITGVRFKRSYRKETAERIARTLLAALEATQAENVRLRDDRVEIARQAYRAGYGDGYVDALLPEGSADDGAEERLLIDATALVEGFSAYRDCSENAIATAPRSTSGEGS